jgi:hypothetical protein
VIKVEYGEDIEKKPEVREGEERDIETQGTSLEMRNKKDIDQLKNLGVGIESSKLDSMGPSIIDKVASDPDFRQQVKKDPMNTLQEMGITLSPEVERQLSDALEKDPDLLINVMLGKEQPLGPIGIGAVPGVIVGVQVVKYVAVWVGVQTRDQDEDR